MKLRKIPAVLAVSALALGGLMVGGSAAVAAPPMATHVVPISVPAGQTETDVYNQWHYSPTAGYSAANPQPNGLLVAAGAKSQWVKGNGNDGATEVDTTSIDHLAKNMSAVTSDPTSVFFQIAVFYGTPGAWKFTTLRKNVADSSDVWMTSSPIAGSAYAQDSADDIDQLVAAIDAAAAAVTGEVRAIATGLLVWEPSADTLVSSLTVNGVTTKFYAAPTADGVNNTATSGFVHSNDIRPNAATYPGWHQGVTGANLGTFASIENGQAVNGLKVTGKSQILNGFAPENFLDNNLPELLAGGVSVYGVPASDAVGYTFQIPMFFYAEGAIGQQFTTLRLEVPANGAIPADLSTLWTTSRAIPGAGVGAHEAGTLGNLLGAMSSYQVLGYGAYIETGSVTLESITFNGLTTTFVKAAPAPSPEKKPAGPQALTNTGSGDWAPMVGIAGVALLAVGGALLAARRTQQS
mgnify:CR=1 FL=1